MTLISDKAVRESFSEALKIGKDLSEGREQELRISSTLVLQSVEQQVIMHWVRDEHGILRD